KLFCCNQSTDLKEEQSKEGSKRNGVTTQQPDATWRVGQPLSAENGIGVESRRSGEHIELARLTSDASRLNDPKIEPDDDLDPNVIQEVSHEELARYSTESPFTPRDSSGPSTSRDSFHDIDLNAKEDNNTARSIEEVAREYNRNKREIIQEIEREEEEEEVQAVISKKPEIPSIDLSIPQQTKSENEAMQIIASDSVLSQIDAEFKEVMDEVDEESDEELKRTMNERLNASHQVLREVLSRNDGIEDEIESLNEEKKNWNIDDDSPSPASSATGEERNEENRPRPISFDDDSDVEHLLNGMESERTNTSSLPAPPPHIDTTSPSNLTVGPLSSSSGFATSTMYSAASDDSDVSDGEEVPVDKRLFDLSSDEGTAGHEKMKKEEEMNRGTTRLSLKSTGEATVSSGEIRVELPKEKSCAVTDEEFSEKLV
ncbi:hypothetical protein PFISCL1PPCAC_15290, partial [Pristionchus fissidentatus]